MFFITSGMFLLLIVCWEFMFCFVYHEWIKFIIFFLHRMSVFRVFCLLGSVICFFLIFWKFHPISLQIYVQSHSLLFLWLQIHTLGYLIFKIAIWYYFLLNFFFLNSLFQHRTFILNYIQDQWFFFGCAMCWTLWTNSSSLISCIFILSILFAFLYIFHISTGHAHLYTFPFSTTYCIILIIATLKSLSDRFNILLFCGSCSTEYLMSWQCFLYLFFLLWVS